MRAVRRLLPLIVTALVLSACGQSGTHRVTGSAAPLATISASAPPPACALGRLTTQRSATVLHVVSAFRARRSPGGRALARISPLNRFGLPTTLLALEARFSRSCLPTWYRAKLPLQPNGITGWVPAWAVASTRVSSRIVADISARTLVLYRDDRRVLSLRAGFGADLTPTPIGSFYIDAHWRVSNAAGPYGPAVLAIAAYSEAPRGRWERGVAAAVHGTDAPWTIGRRASHGCIHVANAELARLLRLAPDGTPIMIRA